MLGAGDSVLEDEVHSLTRALYHATALENFGQAAIPWCLPIEQGLHGDLWKQAAWALNGKRGGCVVDEDAVSEQIITVANGIEERFTHRAFGKGRQLPDEESGLEGLPGIATGLIDLLPKEVLPREETFLKLQTQIRRSRGGSIAKLVNQFGLGQVPAHSLPGTEENQGGIDQSAVRQKQFCVAKQLLMAEALDPLCVPLP